MPLIAKPSYQKIYKCRVRRQLKSRNHNQKTKKKKTSSSSRKMSTETQEPPKYEWLIVAPDYADVLEKRMAVRQYVISDQC